jgi:hypothetical protein
MKSNRLSKRRKAQKISIIGVLDAGWDCSQPNTGLS